ncbi:hypothetical protein DH2020_025080 [Rehmannia glutinosa]|uniref:PB1-like domain-containing protein n=1 Tax=Rehmannia glutinosa TaxID=99300 RepID=A0ABR0W0Q5_REHGL
MKIRPSEDFDLPPPDYDSKSRLLTVTFYYGGKFIHHPSSDYVGGFAYKFDDFEFDLLKYAFKKLTEQKGVKEPMRFYILVSGGFIFLKDDSDLIRICEEIIKTSREVTIYTDDWGELWCSQSSYVPEVNLNNVQLGLDGLTEEGEELNGFEGLSEEGVNEEDDESFTDSNYIEESDTIDDSKLYNENVDFEVEWLNKDDEAENEGLGQNDDLGNDWGG